MHVVIGIIAGLAVAQAAILATTVYLHRGLAHRAVTVHPAVAVVLRAVLWVTTGLKRREWAAVHRRHHSSTDTVDDPHSPLVLGFWRVQLANAALYRRTARDGVTVDRYARDLPADALDRWLFDRAWLGLAVGITLLCLILGWQTGLLASGVHLIAYLGLSGSINAVGHTVGRRPHPNSATNGRLLALVTGGEGLHNNHHDAPTAARFARRFGDIDPGWWAVRALAWVRLARIRHRTVPARAG